MNYADLFRVTLPETALEVAALLVLVVDLGVSAQGRTAHAHGCGDCCWAFWAAWLRSWVIAGPGRGMISCRDDRAAALPPADSPRSRKLRILALTALTLLLLIDATFTRHVGEFVAVVLMSATGGLLIAAAQDLLVIFIGLELLSLGLYILTAFAKSPATAPKRR